MMSPPLPPRSLIILISGKRYSGKDFIADTIKVLFEEELRKFDCYTQKIPTAQRVKIQYARDMNLPLDRLYYDRAFKEYHREGLIKLAQEAKSKKESVWIDHSIDHFLEVNRKEPSKRHVFLVPDLRFKCEYEALISNEELKDEFDLLFLRVNCSRIIREVRGLFWCSSIDEGISETDLDSFEKFDLCIENSSNDVEHIDSIKKNLIEILLKVLDQSS